MATGLPVAATEKILAFLDVGGTTQPPSSSSEPPPPPAPPLCPPSSSSAGTTAVVPPPSTETESGATSTSNDPAHATAPPHSRLTLPPTTSYLLSSVSDPHGSPAFDVVDHAFGRDFCAALRAEVKERGWLDGLKPAVTAMDIQAGRLGLGPLLGQNGSSERTESSEQKQSMPRGDMSTFVPREARRDPKFRLMNPRLHELVTGIQSEVICRFSCTKVETSEARSASSSSRLALRFDETMTSIQISQYPGNGSYYVRHCDRGATCASPEDLEMLSSPSAADTVDVEGGVGRERGPPQRLLTAVYYLNEEDWSPERDGGSLRVYPPKRRRRRGHNGNGDVEEEQQAEQERHHDVEPLSDRLVLFRSDLVEHEVLPCFRTRLAVTIWLYGWLVPVKGRCGEVPPSSSSVHDDATGRGKNREDESMAGRSTHGNGAMDESRLKEELIVPRNSAKDGGSKLQHERGPSRPPPLPTVSREDEEGSIFVAIPSYRDSEIYPTIRDLVDKATSPDRVFVGVVLQIDTTAALSPSPAEEHSASCGGETDEKSLRRLLPPDWSRSNLRVVTVHHCHSTGPCWARSVAQGLWRGETYVLQIDSHMRFRRNWDSYLIRQLGRCPNPGRSVLTAYPQGYNLPDDVPDDVRPTFLVPSRFDDDGMLRQRGRLLKDAGTSSSGDDDDENIPCPLWAAGFNFGTSDALVMCPYDPHLHHLFFGEEVSMAVKLFTHGFDFFAPPTAVCYHLWSRDHRPTFRTADVVDVDGGGTEEARTKEQMKEKSMAIVLGQLRGGGRGLGDVRTVEQFAERVGVDFATRTLSPDAENAGIDPSRFVESAMPNDLLLSLTEKVVQSTSSVQ